MARLDLSKIIDIADIVHDVVKTVAKRPSSELAPKDAPAVAKEIAPKVAARVEEKVNAVVENATNAEPWYQSRVVIGTIVGLAATGAGFLGYHIDAVDQKSIVDVSLEIAAVAGMAYALYGRLIARYKKPLGK